MQEQVRQWAVKQLAHYARDGEVDINRLAIIASKRFKHPHWCMDCDHWVYDILLDVAKREGYDVSYDELVDREDYTPKDIDPMHWQYRIEDAD